MKKELYYTKAAALTAARDYAEEINGMVAAWKVSAMDSDNIDYSEPDNYGGEYPAFEVYGEDGTTCAFFGWNEK